jgi:hypothetical protein
MLAAGGLDGVASGEEKGYGRAELLSKEGVLIEKCSRRELCGRYEKKLPCRG